jgi:hypothetical protein
VGISSISGGTADMGTIRNTPQLRVNR